MATTTANPKQLAHELIERMTPGQVSAVVGLLEVMLDPAQPALVRIPLEDEEISEEEERAVAASKAWLAEHPGEGTSHEELMAEFGLSPESLDN
jgi:hypothetical protein